MVHLKRGPFRLIGAELGRGILFLRRAVHTPWHRRAGTSNKNIPSEKNTPAHANDMHLYTTRSQGGEMLQCAKEVADRASGHHLSFSEFRQFSKELKRTNERSPRQLGKLQDRNGQEKKKKPRKMSKNNVTFDVFLGGSCNPTTWRHDIAIPHLESSGITYYNPQVSEWNAELIQVEHKAKANAKILFYVLDRQTRNVVGIVEAAHFAGASRNLVLVIDTYQQGQLVAGETISNREFEELKGGLATLHDLVKRRDIPVYSHIPTAIRHTAEMLGKKTDNDQFVIKNNKVNSIKQLPNLREMFEALDKTGSGEITVSQFCLAYEETARKKLSVKDLNGIVGGRKDDCMSYSKLNYEQFRTLAAELKIQNGMTEKWMTCCANVPPAGTQHNFDIYVGGSCFDNSWKQQFAIPLLQNSGLKYKLAECGSESSSRAGPSEADCMETSYVLLFVITSNTRGLETMAMASYYIGLGRNVILCIQELPQGCEIAKEKLTKTAIGDYNRGRYYLADEARHKNVPVFQNVSEAVRCAIDRCIADKGLGSR